MSAIQDVASQDDGVRDVGKVIGFLAVALAFGWVLAWVTINFGVATGWIGAAALIGWALIARRRWEWLRKTSGADPGGPERVVWHRATGTAVACGHMLTTLSHPHIDLHVGSGNSLATDSWTMLAAIIISAFVFHRDSGERDERDAAIAAQGLKAGYTTLIALLLALSFLLGFAPPDVLAPFTHFFIGNLLIALIVISALAHYGVQLLGYSQDACAARDLSA